MKGIGTEMALADKPLISTGGGREPERCSGGVGSEALFA
jgi:hypothetical protein